MKELKFFLITDTHYFKYSLGAYGKAYEEFMDFEQKCFAETSAINKAAFSYLEQSDEADIVLIAGDLSFNGEKESHIEFEKLLRHLRESGKRVFVVTAAHDINEHPFAFDDSGRIEPAGTRFDELYDIYRDYGYDDSIAFDREHMSYVAQLGDGVRLLVLCNDTPEKHSVAYSDELLLWAVAQAKKAQEDGQMMIAMEHYPVLPGQPVLQFIPDARQKESKKLINALADNGVHLIFTGHMHNQSINVTKSDSGNVFYDVCTGSVIGCPAFMRLVTVLDESTVDIKSIPVPEFEWDKGGKSGKEYLQCQFERMIRSMITGMRDNPAKLLGKFGAGDKKALFKPVSIAGKAMSTWSVGKVARLLLVRADKSIKDEPFLEFAIAVVRSVFEGDQPFKEGTPGGDVILKLFRRHRLLTRTLNKKLHGSQGEQVDFYDVIKNTIGNYGISDYDAVLHLKQ